MKKMQIGMLIKKARLDLGHSREWLGQEINVATTTILRWEKGLQSPSFEHMIMVSEALNMPLNFFAGIEDNASSDHSISLIKQIASLGPDQLETLKENLNILSKQTQSKSKKKEA